MPGDEMGDRADRGEPEQAHTEDVEAWPPEGEAEVPEGQAPERDQARQVDRSDPPMAGPAAPHEQDSDVRNWATAAHLSSLVGLLGIPAVVGPLVVWLMKKDDHPFVETQAREALNFQISVLIYAVVGAILAVAVTVLTLGLGALAVIPAALIFLVGVFVLPIVAAIKTSDGTDYRYPLTLRLVSAPNRGGAAR